MIKEKDDFEWNKYTEIYLSQIKSMLKEGIVFKFKNSYIDKNNKLILKDNICTGALVIYNDVIRLKNEINNVFECGCGAGYHLYNIKYLFPEIEINGCDLLKSQVEKAGKLLKIPKAILKKILIRDFIKDDIPKGDYDYIFTNAVLVHLSQDRAIIFINNVVKLKPKFIRFNAGCNNWEGVIKKSGILKRYKRIEQTFFKRIECD